MGTFYAKVPLFMVTDRRFNSDAIVSLSPNIFASFPPRIDSIFLFVKLIPAGAFSVNSFNNRIHSLGDLTILNTGSSVPNRILSIPAKSIRSLNSRQNSSKWPNAYRSHMAKWKYGPFWEKHHRYNFSC